MMDLDNVEYDKVTGRPYLAYERICIRKGDLSNPLKTHPLEEHKYRCLSFLDEALSCPIFVVWHRPSCDEFVVWPIGATEPMEEATMRFSERAYVNWIDSQRPRDSAVRSKMWG